MGSGSSRQRPPRSRPEDDQQQQQQPLQQQQQQQPPPGPYGYAPSPVHQPPQHPYAHHPQHAPPHAGVSNGQYYGGYHPAYAGMLPPGQPQLPPMPGHYGQPPRLPPPPTHEYKQTQTIKNTVNLRKNTLRLEPCPGSPNQLLLQFAFDASVPCRVTTFLLATEDPAQACRIVGAVADPRMPGYYDRGIDCRFPQSDAMAQQHAVDLGRHSTSLLTLATGNSYPLIIRLEALTEQAAAEGRQLQQLEVGGPLPVWAQAQSTYARLKADDEGRWGLQILKQKIWVRGVSYELQEIYGMEATRTAAAGGSGGSGGAPSEDVEGRECVICMSAPRDTTVLPCRHMCMCQPCAAALRTQTNKCPICREPMESLLHIKL